MEVYYRSETSASLVSCGRVCGWCRVYSWVVTYEDEFPKHLGHPVVAPGMGRKLHRATKPTYTVELDAGAFMAMWEHMEAEAKRRFPMHEIVATYDAYLRAVTALRQTYWATHEPPPPPAEKPRKRLVRKR